MLSLRASDQGSDTLAICWEEVVKLSKTSKRHFDCAETRVDVNHSWSRAGKRLPDLCEPGNQKSWLQHGEGLI